METREISRWGLLFFHSPWRSASLLLPYALAFFLGGGLAPSLPVLVSQLAQFGLASSLMVGPTGDCKVPHLISPSGSAEGEEKKC